MERGKYGKSILNIWETRIITIVFETVSITNDGFIIADPWDACLCGKSSCEPWAAGPKAVRIL